MILLLRAYITLRGDWYEPSPPSLRVSGSIKWRERGGGINRMKKNFHMGRLPKRKVLFVVASSNIPFLSDPTDRYAKERNLSFN